MDTLGVEFDSSHPVDMAFTAHDQVTIWDGPQLPSCVIAACRDNVFLWVVAERGHSAKMTLESLRQ